MTQRILYIDDNPANLDLVKEILSFEDYEVLMALNGDEGLRVARQHHPDLVLCDLMMPGISGSEVTEKLRADAATRDVPIIMLTADYNQSHYRESFEAGANGYLTKPINRQRLLNTIREYLPVDK